MKILQVLVFSFAFFFLNSSYAVTLNATKIGGIHTTTPISDLVGMAAVGFRSLTPMGAAVAVGRALMIMSVADSLNSLRLQAGQASAFPVPANWPNYNTPPSSFPVGIVYGNTTSPFIPVAQQLTVNDYCIAVYNYRKSTNGTIVRWDVQPISGFSYCQGYNSSNAVQYSDRAGPITGCPVGYSTSGSNCVLADQNLVIWPSDNVPTYQLLNGNLVPYSKDPDNYEQSTVGSITRTGTDIYSNPSKETVTPNAAGGLDYVRDTQSVNSATGEPMVQRDRFATDANGLINQSSSTTYNNSTISSVNTTIAPQIDTSLLAKDATLQDIKGLLDPNANLPPVVPPGEEPSFFDFMNTSNPFGWSFSSFLPDLPSSGCTYELHETFHVPFLGNKTLDLAPCAPLQPLRDVLAWVFGVLTMMGVFFLIFKSHVQV